MPSRPGGHQQAELPIPHRFGHAPDRGGDDRQSEAEGKLNNRALAGLQIGQDHDISRREIKAHLFVRHIAVDHLHPLRNPELFDHGPVAFLGLPEFAHHQQLDCHILRDETTARSRW
jgi:hypothetical protein